MDEEGKKWNHNSEYYARSYHSDVLTSAECKETRRNSPVKPYAMEIVGTQSIYFRWM